jgi:hypothetical protein
VNFPFPGTKNSQAALKRTEVSLSGKKACGGSQRLSPILFLFLLFASATYALENDTNASRPLQINLLPDLEYDPDNGFGYGLNLILLRDGSRAGKYDFNLNADLEASTDFRTLLKTINSSVILDLPAVVVGDFRLHLRFLAAYHYLPFEYFDGIGDSDAAIGYSSLMATNHQYTYLSDGGFVQSSVAIPFADRNSGSFADAEFWTGLRYLQEKASESPVLPAGNVAPELAAEKPLGWTGGEDLSFQTGIVLDTRDFAPNPRSGIYAEADAEYSPKLFTDSFDFFRTTAIFAFFWSPLSFYRNFTIADRISMDALIGEVPFYELATTGGLNPNDGFGGQETLRGVPRNRYIGPCKLFDNLEIRFRWLDFPVSIPGFEDVWHIENTLFLDTGGAWTNFLPGNQTMAATYGAGLKLVRGEDTVYSFDFSFWNASFAGVYADIGQEF